MVAIAVVEVVPMSSAFSFTIMCICKVPFSSPYSKHSSPHSLFEFCGQQQRGFDSLPMYVLQHSTNIIQRTHAKLGASLPSRYREKFFQQVLSSRFQMHSFSIIFASINGIIIRNYPVYVMARKQIYCVT